MPKSSGATLSVARDQIILGQQLQHPLAGAWSAQHDHQQALASASRLASRTDDFARSAAWATHAKQFEYEFKWREEDTALAIWYWGLALAIDQVEQVFVGVSIHVRKTPDGSDLVGSTLNTSFFKHITIRWNQ
ncbi:hypothetical protein [Pseudomonas defluvii]|uniref:hypothetical protein n=1 Tax=Pseudomonas defluvii TaxID=1876757 RepID=UPI0008113B9F|nr:hypothetical protein [Pseudomonas defluvii]